MKLIGSFEIGQIVAGRVIVAPSKRARTDLRRHESIARLRAVVNGRARTEPRSGEAAKAARDEARIRARRIRQEVHIHRRGLPHGMGTQEAPTHSSDAHLVHKLP